MTDIEARKRQYLERVVAEVDDAGKDGHDTVGWCVNHARLALGRDVERANRFFEGFSLRPVPWTGKDGVTTLTCNNFKGVKALKTVLDFGDSDLLSARAKENLRRELLDWVPDPLLSENMRVARYPVIHTENHDMMALTLGLFIGILAGRDPREHVRQLSQSLAWRFERGWAEWHSHVYEMYYMHPVLMVARHAPDENLRKGAAAVLNLMFAERALLSVQGHLAGPFWRGYEEQIADDRKDTFLPIMWMAFGFERITPALPQGVEFASDPFEPDPIVRALARDAAAQPLLEYKGARAVGDNGRQIVVYYNTPHVSMGSQQAHYYGYQARFWNVCFPDEPSRALRTYQRDAKKHSPWDDRNEKGEVVQYRNWLISRGELIAGGGLTARKAGPWDLYRVGKGLCAHAELPGFARAKPGCAGATPGNLHVFQVSDLDKHPSEDAFLAKLTMPRVQGGHVLARAEDGARLDVRLRDMSMRANGRPHGGWRDTMHDSPFMKAQFGTGEIHITTSAGSLTLSHGDLLRSSHGPDRSGPGKNLERSQCPKRS